MRAAAVTAALVAIEAGALAGTADRRLPVIGGNPAGAGEYPATGALLVDLGGGYQTLCTGSLIAPDAVLTAAHCIDPSFGITPAFTLARDVSAISVTDVVAGRQAYVHPQFDINTVPPSLGRWYDIGLLMLEKPIVNAAVEVLPTPDEAALLAVGQRVGLAGYGVTTIEGEDTGVKYVGEASLVEIGEAELLISSPGEPQNCNGDSGGPALIDFGNGLRLVGVVSRSPDDNRICDHGGVDTRADSYLEWIHSRVNIPCGGLAGECVCSGDDCESTAGCGCRGGQTAGPVAILFCLVALLVAPWRCAK